MTDESGDGRMAGNYSGDYAGKKEGHGLPSPVGVPTLAQRNEMSVAAYNRGDKTYEEG